MNILDLLQGNLVLGISVIQGVSLELFIIFIVQQ